MVIKSHANRENLSNINIKIKYNCLKELKIIVKVKENLSGLIIGKLTVLYQDENDYISPSNKKHYAKWICKCECGNIVSIHQKSLKSNLIQSCGCLKNEKLKNPRTKNRSNLIGKTFGRLEVIDFAEDYYNGKKRINVWKCKCVCGKTKNVKQPCLINGKTKSCGCLRQETTSKNHRANLLNQRFGKLQVIKQSCVKNNAVYWLCKCDCGNIKEYTSSQLINGCNKSCGCLVSYGEEQIIKFLINNNVDYESQYWFDDLRNDDTDFPLFFDFMISNNNKINLIEFNGQQHYIDCGDFGKLEREKTDQMKINYCKENNIPLYIIRYDEDIETKMGIILNEILK